jgi:hypothetical protein
MVQLGPLMYGLLECIDGQRDTGELADALSAELGRRVDEKPVVRLAEKLSGQGLLAGSEHQAPPGATRCSRCDSRSWSPTRPGPGG